MVAALVMSTIAVMQFSTPMVWGVLRRAHEYRPGDHGEVSSFKRWAFHWRLSDPGLVSLYAGFFLYGIGMGGTSILAELIWANYFGRISLGKIRGMGSLITSAFRRRPAVLRFAVRRHAKLSCFRSASSSAC